MSAALPRALAPLALMVAIFVASDQPSVGPGLPEWARVLAHMSEYALLAALWAWALAPALGSGALAWAAAISLLYAVSDEWHQSFVPGRDADPLDVVADATGIALALLAVRARASTRATHSARRG